MVTAVTRVENAASDRDKGVVKVGLESAVSVTIDGVQSIRLCDGNVIGCNANDGSCFMAESACWALMFWRQYTIYLVHLVNSFRAVTRLANVGQP